MISGSIDFPQVTRDKAEGLPGVGRGVDLISGVVAQLQPVLVSDEHIRETATTVHDTPALLLNPDPLWHGRSTWLAALTASMVWNGNGFAYAGAEVSDPRGFPIRLPLLDENGVTWGTDPQTGQSAYQVNEYDEQGYNQFGYYSPSEIKHFLVSPRAGKRMGRGIIQRYQTELKIMAATENSQMVIMREGRPVGVLNIELDVSSNEATEYKQAFVKAMNDSSVAALSGAKFQPVSWNAMDLNLVPTREFHLRLASDITGISPYLLGVPSESRVYSNMETEWANFIKVTLGRYLATMEDVLSTCFPRGKTVKFNVDQLLRADATTRWAIYEKAINLKVASPTYVAETEGLPDPPADSSIPATDSGGNA
jgi:HK97 family phage portal protein